MFLQRFVLACASLATSASAYELMRTPCKVGKREFHSASSCIAKATDLAGDGATFAIQVRGDQSETVASLVSALSEVGGTMIQTTEPLMAALTQRSTRAWNELTESIQNGRLVGWQVGESTGRFVGMLVGGATLGSLGFAAGAAGGGLAGYAAGSVASMAVSPLVGILAPDLALLVRAFAVAGGAVLGAQDGASAGVLVGSKLGSELGGLLGGVVSSEIGGLLGAASSVYGMLFQLADGVVLAIDYAIRNGAAEALSYHLVVQQNLLLS